MEKITNDFEKVIAVLNQLSISYELVENGPVLLTEQADNFIVGIEGVRTKIRECSIIT
ncbi:TPA: hypothetical protein ACJ5U5_000384 [Streptococcus agalactiae]